MAEPSLAAAFLAGLAGFASPCVLPIVPAYLRYLGGVASGDAPGAGMKVFASALAFVAGLVLALGMLGIVLEKALGYVSGDAVLIAGRVSGALIILLGLHILGLIRLDFLARRHGLRVPESASLAASFVTGALFALIWTPLMGAFLLFVLALAISQPGSAPLLLLSYAAGLGIPFLLAGAFASQASAFIRKHGREMAIFDRAMGILVLAAGVWYLAGGFGA
jgi:cytochrome c-type biogenesis protein